MWTLAAFAFGAIAGWMLASVSTGIKGVEREIREDAEREELRATISDLELRIADARAILDGSALSITAIGESNDEDIERDAPDMS